MPPLNRDFRNADANAGAWRLTFYWLWSLLLSLKLFLAWQLQLFGDEAFYAWEATRLAWAYSDLPGMTAWLIRAGIEIGGYAPFAARMAFVLIGVLIPFFVIRIARYFSGDAQAYAAGVLSCCLPIMLPVGFMALPEAPLCLAALLCLDAILRLRDKCGYGACIQLAAGLMIGAMTHYRFLVVLMAGGLGVVLSGAWRHWRDRRFLLAILLGASAWLPLLFYNLQHDFAAVQYQFGERHPWRFSALGVAQLPIQAIVATPFLYAALLWCLWHVFKAWRQGAKAMGMMLGAAGLPIVFFALSAFFTDRHRITYHWPLQAYFPLIALLPRFISENFPDRQAKLHGMIVSVGLIGVIAAFSYLMTAAAPGLSARLADTRFYPDNFVGWTEVSAATQSLLRTDEILIADNFMLAAQLHFHLEGAREIHVLDHSLNYKHGRARQLRDWSVDSRAISALRRDAPVLIVIEESSTRESLRDQWRAELCAQFSDLRFERVVHGPGRGKSFSIFRALTGAKPGTSCNTEIE